MTSARRADDRLQTLATGIGWLSLGLGFALTLSPRRSAAVLGWGDREGLARSVGVADLAVGAGLISGRYPSRWMLARALLNAVLALIYAGVLEGGTPQRGRVRGWLGLMVLLTLFDHAVSRRLR